MPETVSWVLEVAIREGKLDEGRALMEEMAAATGEELGTLAYEWFLSSDGSVCHVYVRYADSEAVMLHMRAFGDAFAERFAACFEQTRMTVYGEPSDEVRTTLGDDGVAYLTTWGGFSR